jgi:hypothetical protein
MWRSDKKMLSRIWMQVLEKKSVLSENYGEEGGASVA